MAIVQQVQDGKLVNTTASATSSSKKTESSGSDMDKMDFLNLLVAEMQYQDPLEPQSNTDYVAQLATFTQVEDIESMQSTVQNMQANNLVGKYVILNVTDSTTGVTSTVTGKVDYVMYEDGETYLAVNDGLYSMDDLDTVANDEYMEASMMAITFKQLIAKLPTLTNLTTSDAASVAAVRSVYDGLTTYQKTFIDADDLKSLETLEERLTAWGVYGKDTATDTDTDSSTDTSKDTDTSTDETT